MEVGSISVHMAPRMAGCQGHRVVGKVLPSRGGGGGRCRLAAPGWRRRNTGSSRLLCSRAVLQRDLTLWTSPCSVPLCPRQSGSLGNNSAGVCAQPHLQGG